MSQELWTAQQVADFFSVTTTTIHSQRARGQKPGALGIKINGSLRWRPEDIEDFVRTLAQEQIGTDR